MTHEERVWELYKGFAIAQFHNYQTIMEESDDLMEESKEYHNMAEAFATNFEKLSEEREGRMSSSQPFENRVPDFKVTAMEG